MMEATETPKWWAAALPTAPTFTAAGSPQWLVADRETLPLAHCVDAPAARFADPQRVPPLFFYFCASYLIPLCPFFLNLRHCRGRGTAPAGVLCIPS